MNCWSPAIGLASLTAMARGPALMQLAGRKASAAALVMMARPSGPDQMCQGKVGDLGPFGLEINCGWWLHQWLWHCWLGLTHGLLPILQLRRCDESDLGVCCKLLERGPEGAQVSRIDVAEDACYKGWQSRLSAPRSARALDTALRRSSFVGRLLGATFL